MEKRIPYDVEGARMTNACLARILRAVVQTNAQVLDSCVLDSSYQNKNMSTVGFRVMVPEGKQQEFQRIAEVTLSLPPKVVGMLT